ncbi:MAG TPA: DUF559 domain-containing protein [Caulobacteraceae bacterium]|jgi:very-short-patch-repair endonuclease
MLRVARGRLKAGDMRAPPRTIQKAKALRRELTPPEVVLWAHLRARRLHGLHFRKQHPVGPYVLDFYCSAARLAVEVDSEIHAVGDRPLRDARRDAWLDDQRIRTLRVTAGDVASNIDGVLQGIAAAAQRPLSHPAGAG